jgi:predicted Zn-dependent protease
MESHASTHVARCTHTSYDLDTVFQKLSPHDAAGLWCSGPVIRGYANTKGTKHWFSADQFFLDYSLYTTDQKAVKKLLAGSGLSLDELDTQLLDATQSLSLMKGSPKVLEPGPYRVYFSPSAVQALIAMLSWGATSYGSYKKGQSALKELADGAKELSPKVTLSQDFSHGLMPRFNSYGATAPEELTLIDQGKLAHFLVSERTAKEYNVPSNAASASEGIRSATLACGTLDPDHALKVLDRGIYIDHLHYLNWSDMQSGRITGMTRYACFWVENGEKVAPIKDMRFDETLYHFLGKGLVDLTTQHAMIVDTGTYDQRSLSIDHMPGMLVSDFHFTL